MMVMYSITWLFDNLYYKLVIRAIIIIVVFLFLKLIIIHPLRRLAKHRGDNSYESYKGRKTRLVFLNKFISALLMLIGFFIFLGGIPAFKTFSYSILAGAGVIAIVLGFATQKTLSNVISGISLALYEPIRVGDRIRMLDEIGEVEDISLRHITIKTWDNRRLLIPNSLMDEKEVINYSINDETILWTTEIGISYDASISKAKKAMLELAIKHKGNLIHQVEKKEKKKYMPYVRVVKCADFSVVLKLYFWASDVYTAWVMGYDLLELIKLEFDKKHIEIPYPYRTVVYKSDLENKKKKK